MSPIFVGGRTIYGALSSQPTGITTTAGSEYYDTTDNQKYIYSGTSNSWRKSSGEISTSNGDPFGDGSAIATFQLNGNATSLSGTTFTGTLSGDNSSSNFANGGKYGQYWIGSGTTHLTATSTQIRPSASYTLSFWYKSNTTNQNNKRVLTVQGTNICSGWNNYNGSMGFYTGAGNSNVNTTPVVERRALIPDATINDNNWHHVAYTISAVNTWQIYLDGSEYNNPWSGTTETRSFNNSTYFAVTTYEGGDNYNTICGIDQIRLFSKVLTATEIGDLYNES